MSPSNSNMTNHDITIQAEALTKTFGNNLAVDHLDLSIHQGELYGLVGPDGAGKTTILRMLATIMLPSSGQAWVAGHSILKDEKHIKEQIGYMSQRFGLYEDLTVMENILFYADLYEVARKERPSRIERLLGFSNLTPFQDRLAGKLSGGMKQKLGLACALIHTPKVLFLDEPTNGVDPVSRRDFWRILYDLLKEDITIMVSTAYLDEAERCTRVGLIHKGKFLVEDTPNNIKKSLPEPMLELWTEDARQSQKLLRSIDGVLSISMYGEKLHVRLSDLLLESVIRETLTRSGIKIIASRRILPSLEDVFITRVES